MSVWKIWDSNQGQYPSNILLGLKIQKINFLISIIEYKNKKVKKLKLKKMKVLRIYVSGYGVIAR